MRARHVTSLLSVVAAAAWAISVVVTQPVRADHLATEAPAGFDGESNGFITGAAFEEAKEEFTGPEGIPDGLGPVYNAAGCGECHATPVLGGSSQILERRAGRWDGSSFLEHPGGSLIQDRATDARVQETVLSGHNVVALRSSLNVLGDGFVEAVDANDLIDLSRSQPSSMRGTFIQVPVLEAEGRVRGGRFGWKNQHASLVSFSADAYLNEMGITSPLQMQENLFNGEELPADLDLMPEPEDDGADVQLFADFMRSTKAPPVDADLASTSDAIQGSQLFDQIGCKVCHTRTIVTSPPGTIINGGAFTVPPALGNKIIHPFSDFLMHDIGTGDGIVQNGGPGTRNQLRTAPLWGLRTRGRFMHDGASHSVLDAIRRHGGQASNVRKSFDALSSSNRRRILTFLNSL